MKLPDDDGGFSEEETRKMMRRRRRGPCSSEKAACHDKSAPANNKRTLHWLALVNLLILYDGITASLADIYISSYSQILMSYVFKI